MPKIKKKSNQQRINDKKIYARIHRVEIKLSNTESEAQADRLEVPTTSEEDLCKNYSNIITSSISTNQYVVTRQPKKIQTRNDHAMQRERNKESQHKRLLSPTKRALQREREKVSQKKRMLSPTKRALQRDREKVLQKKRMLSPTNRTLQRQREKVSQQKRLSNPTKRALHRVNDKLSHQKRLLSPNKRALHRVIDKLSHQKRLLSPSKRALHRVNDKLSHQKRLLSPSKRALHRVNDKLSHQKRLLSPSKRDLHRQREKVSQQKRLLSPSKRDLHRQREKVSQQKRLLSPSKGDLHRQREKVSQQKRLQSPRKRAHHIKHVQICHKILLSNPSKRKHYLNMLRLYQKRRLLLESNRKKHLIRLRKAQRQRLMNPAGRILHVSRVLTSQIARQNRLEVENKKQLYESFLTEKKEGPTYICASCHRLWFKFSIKYRSVLKLDSNLLRTACGEVEGDNVNLCASCYKSLRVGKMPTLSLGRKDLHFPIIPPEIATLTELEERFLCPRIPFMSIRAVVGDQQYMVKGRAVNVPIEVPAAVKILPRSVKETNVVPICFRRRKFFNSNMAFENVRPYVINKAAILLEKSPLYQHFNIILDIQRINEYVNFVNGTNMANDSEDSAENEEMNVDDEDLEPINVADDETMLASAIIFAPGEGRKPESLFADFVEAQSFIKIYGGQLIGQPKDLSYQNWIKSEIMRDDRRCATVTKLFFSALKLRTAKMCSSISFCLRKTKAKKNDITAKHVLDENTVKNLEAHDSGFRVFAADRAPAYWELKKKELFAMMRQLGPPTLFLILSPSETRWPELIVILKKILDDEIISEDMAASLSYQEKVQLIKNDPVTVARYFDYRMRRLLNLLKKNNSVFQEYNVIDFYIRTEFQQRGSPHLHCLL